MTSKCRNSERRLWLFSCLTQLTESKLSPILRSTKKQEFKKLEKLFPSWRRVSRKCRDACICRWRCENIHSREVSTFNHILEFRSPPQQFLKYCGSDLNTENCWDLSTFANLSQHHKWNFTFEEKTRKFLFDFVACFIQKFILHDAIFQFGWLRRPAKACDSKRSLLQVVRNCHWWDVCADCHHTCS